MIDAGDIQRLEDAGFETEELQYGNKTFCRVRGGGLITDALDHDDVEYILDPPPTPDPTEEP